VPELPEVESARRVIEGSALGRRIATVEDSDEWVCRPHRPGDLGRALVGRRLTAVHRRGKSLWCDTSGVGRARTPGPTLGIHLGMSGKIVIADRAGREIEGGDYWERGRAPGDYRYARFTLTFADGGAMILIDPRRLGRVRLDPAIELLGPDARTITPAEFRAALSGGTAPIKARLLDQSAVAGIGNLLADQILWQAKVFPGRPVRELDATAVARLQRATHRSVEQALAGGGVHTLSLIEHRRPGGHCPRDGSPLAHGRFGGRTTWWCPTEQV